MPPVLIVRGRRRTSAAPQIGGRWRVRSGLLEPYHVVDPISKMLLPTSTRRALLQVAMRRRNISAVDAIRHINAVRNYLRNKVDARSAAIRRLYTRDILFLQNQRRRSLLALN